MQFQQWFTPFGMKIYKILPESIPKTYIGVILVLGWPMLGSMILTKVIDHFRASLSVPVSNEWLIVALYSAFANLRALRI